MKIKIFILIFAVTSVFLSAKSAEAALIIKAPPSLGLISGLVGHWTFDGNDIAGTKALDRSGNGNHGTITNGPANTPGKIGQALEFDGSNDYIVTANAPALDIFGTSPISMSAWIKVNSFPTADSEHNIIMMITETGNGATTYDKGLSLHRTGNSIFPESYFYSGGARHVTGTTSIELGRWHHLVGMYNGSHGLIYLDGIQVGVLAIGSTHNHSGARLLIGGIIGHQSFDEYFNGLIDDVRIYNRALSADEIKRLYRAGGTLKLAVTNSSQTLRDGLVGHWSFDGNTISETSVADLSGQGNHGTLVNGPATVSGKIGQALSFDGVNDHVRITPVNDAHDVTASQSFSLSAWVKTTSTAESQIILRRSDSIPYYQFGVNRVSCSLVGQAFLAMRGSSGENTRCSVTLVNDGAWHHIVGVRDTVSDTTRIYIDGVLEASGTDNSVGNLAVTNPLWIANTGVITTGPVYANVSVDDVRMYNRTISPDEVKRLYRIGATLKIGVPNTTGTLSSGLIGHWSFDGPTISGTSVADVSGQGNHGTLVNGPATTPGKLGQAINFDGVDDRTDHGNVFNFERTDTFSVSLWWKRNGTDPPTLTEGLISKRQLSVQFRGWSLGVSGSVINNPYSVILGSNGTASLLRVDFPRSGDTAWHHVVFTYSGNSAPSGIKLYEDGIAKTGTTVNNTLSSTIVNNAASLQFAAINGMSFFPGSIDDVRVYNRLLTTDEINRLYLMGR